MDDAQHAGKQGEGKVIPHKPRESSAVEDFYDEDVLIEWQRLERHRTEFAVTMRVLDEYLPPSPQAILDDGGGPGRYSLALSALGYQVTLFDLSAENLNFARKKASEKSQKPIHAYVHGNALDLTTLGDQHFDAVLLLGPLYHLLTAAERKLAVHEAQRILRPGGIIVAAFLLRYAALRDLAKHAPLTLFEKHDAWEEILRTGVYQDNQDVGFTSAYFALPTEVRPLMEEAGFETLGLVGCEGVVAANEEPVNQLTGDAWRSWVDLNYRLGKEPSLHGASDHLLYVGKK